MTVVSSSRPAPCSLIPSKIVRLLPSSGMLSKCAAPFWMNSNGTRSGIDCSSGKMLFSEYCLTAIINNCCSDNFLISVITVACICIFFNSELSFKERPF
ncbi:major capsid protein, putative [Listeria monocytogenes str. 4b H7858]|nr:major capsid protein, putative [Listeria monocytogenes str. 4b H7858] [Listeria monocytogenes serotype 4b str. H7858]